MGVFGAYRSLDGTVHRSIDRLGRGVDSIRSGMRPVTGALLSSGALFQTIVAQAATPDALFKPYDLPGLVVGAMLATIETGSALYEVSLGSSGRDEPRRYVNDGIRALALAPAVGGTLFAAYGVIGALEGIVSGSFDPQNVRRISIGLFFTGPAVSSYLRDRDPPAPEKDPMLAYLPKMVRPALETAE